MMSKYSLIKEFLEPPFLIEFAAKPGAAENQPRTKKMRIAEAATESAEAGGSQAGPRQRAPRLARAG
jgi:hypothetical protein